MQWRHYELQLATVGAVALAAGVQAWSPAILTEPIRWGFQILKSWGLFDTPALVTLFGAFALLTLTFTRSIRIPKENPTKATPQQLRPLRWQLVALAIIAISLITWLALNWLLGVASNATDTASARIEAIRTALTIGAGTGGAIALMLTARRQWLAEHAQMHTESDSAQQRANELYAQSIEQLGHEKAPVRLGALYALEQLAQHNVKQRQTVVNVVCAYLRIPVTSTLASYLLSKSTKEDEINNASKCETDIVGENKEATEHSPGEQELHVRVAAQQILTRHLSTEGNSENPANDYWPDIDIDLRGAVLLDFYLPHGARIRNAQFSRAEFHGYTSFSHATFSNLAIFSWVKFRPEIVSFDGASFPGGADFEDAEFIGDASFEKAHFGNTLQNPAESSFSGTVFEKEANFNRATFSHGPNFSNVEFKGDADFSNATLNQSKYILKGDAAQFTNTLFLSDVKFTQWSGHKPRIPINLSGSQVFVNSTTQSRRIWPAGWIEESRIEQKDLDGGSGVWHRLIPE
ncbi:pentapeptide repeat-containing protein [Saccharopolyspora aridisoli]|nr:pentapeptide repeat-containing protein [Saccharopolyspora aridisoli]